MAIAKNEYDRLVAEVASEFNIPQAVIMRIDRHKRPTRARHALWRKLHEAGMSTSAIAGKWKCHRACISHSFNPKRKLGDSC